MHHLQALLPACVYAHATFALLHLLYHCDDRLWGPSRRAAYFALSRPRISAKLAGECLHSLTKGTAEEATDAAARVLACPVALFFGEEDALVDASRTELEVKACATAGVRWVARVCKYRHADLLLAADAHTAVFAPVASLVRAAAASDGVVVGDK
eukprot:TRINITY_DN6935_c0_g1_i3.p1 TRINITY_DN6935_c0_g1~~TRINITY_DN6935_c0_g1_i3.p1  ORF type:complete len:155 (-),score=41.55 TRINITY_DN6935_c0_g1_i3:239-703(-)